nr:GTP-binding protein [Salipaludibacillus sp. CUR1]
MINIKQIKAKPVHKILNKNEHSHAENIHKHGHTHGHSQSFSRIKTVTLYVNKTTKSSKIEKFLKKWRPNLLRAKGYIPLKDGCYLFQHAMKRNYWEPSQYTGAKYLVLIGINLSTEEIQGEWDKSI